MVDEPVLRFPDDLPISAVRDEIADLISTHQVVIVAGETGSGKTTQLPKICLALGRGTDGMIGHTQPRRIAARSVATRIADELGTPLGHTVGYQVRFHDRTSAASRVKLMTDGILLAELQHDRELRRYDTIIVDEAHERSLNIDFLLGYLKRLLPRRPDLKVIITSATIDPERFAHHFADATGEPAPVIEVSGRTYPVEIRYRPLVATTVGAGADTEGEVLVRGQTEGILAAVHELATDTAGDILVFLAGEREIRDTADALGALAQGPRGFDVLPLYGRLSAGEQHRVFEPSGRRRIVLSTNVAETSLTVPGITGVVDAGLARISRWSPRTKVQRLPIEPVSQASAQQRSGRCGRIEAGVAIRLYSEADFEGRPRFTEPEILRTGLASVILQMAGLGLGDIETFPFIDPPDTRQVRSGVRLLTELGALRPTGRRGTALTRLGRRLARLPTDPQLGRMILEADRLGCLREVLIITAALSVPDPRERPEEKKAQADQAHARFTDPTSDFLTWLNLWDHIAAEQQQMGSAAFRRACRDQYLNRVRIREWQDLESQLRETARQVGIKVPRGTAGGARPDDQIHQAVLSGLLSHIGLRDPEKRDYRGTRGTRFSIFPGSALFRRPPELVMAAELVETSRLWGRQCAAIDPAWVEKAAGDLVTRQYSEPRWSKRRAAAVATERVSLYGVPLVADRTVPYGRIDPVVAREIFIRHALVDGEWNQRHRFLATNRRLLDQAAELEERYRRRDLVVDEETLVEFYDRHLPADVVSGAHFDSWWKTARRTQPDLLTFDPQMLVRDLPEGPSEADFPQEWKEDDVRLPVSYRFDPAASDDGVTIDVPIGSLAHMDPARFTWHVPGMREELVTALLRSLPKPVRVNFVPVPDTARAFLAAVPPADEPLLTALSRYLRASTGVQVPAEAWDESRLPAHLRPTFRIIDGEGRELAAGKDLAVLAEPLRPVAAAETRAAAAAADLTRTGATDWVFGTVPATFRTTRGGHDVRGFPALDDEGATVGLVVVPTEAEQAARHRAGVRRLLSLSVQVPGVLDGLDNAAKLTLAAAPYPSAAAVASDCVLAAAGELVDEVAPVRDEAAFRALLTTATDRLPALAEATLQQVLHILTVWRATDQALQGRVDLMMLDSMTDLKAHVARLVHPGFIGEAGTEALRHYPRYLAGIAERHRRLLADPRSDRELMRRVEPFQEAWRHRTAALPDGQPPDAALLELRWLVEEFRVSLWAQGLGTAVPVSEKRLRRHLEEADRR